MENVRERAAWIRARIQARASDATGNLAGGPSMSARLPHILLDGALRLRAEEYAGTLDIGAVVNETDRRYLLNHLDTNWAALLDEALAARGLMLDGDVVVPLLRQAAE
jgi:hypothetical protein